MYCTRVLGLSNSARVRVAFEALYDTSLDIGSILKISPTDVFKYDADEWSNSLAELAYAWPRLAITARYKSCPDDFRVDEELGFEASGAGEHDWLLIEKTECNTEQV